MVTQRSQAGNLLKKLVFEPPPGCSGRTGTGGKLRYLSCYHRLMDGLGRYDTGTAPVCGVGRSMVWYGKGPSDSVR